MLLRCQQKTVANGSTGVGIGGMMDSTGVMPALLQGLASVGRGGGGHGGHHSAASNDDNETVFYDELISYPTHLSYRPTTHHPPPVYEVNSATSPSFYFSDSTTFDCDDAITSTMLILRTHSLMWCAVCVTRSRIR